MMVVCSCKTEFTSHQAWMDHVMRGLPVSRRSQVVRMSDREQDRIKKQEYTDKHRVVESEILRKERKIA